MIVNARRLFTKLLPAMRINIVCDIGSMDGTEALLFRQAVPRATIYAFEPNPDNFRQMQANRALHDGHIQLVPCAVTNYDGKADLFVVRVDTPEDRAKRGMSSLYRRSDPWSTLGAVVPTPTTRLDSFLACKCDRQDRLALWIDTEGKAHEVIEGIGGVADRVCLIHVEVETVRCIGADQHLYPEVKLFLSRLGFREIATDYPHTQVQFNSLFARRGLPLGMRLHLYWRLAQARFRYLIVCLLRRWCPACLHHYQDLRQRQSVRI